MIAGPIGLIEVIKSKPLTIQRSNFGGKLFDTFQNGILLQAYYAYNNIYSIKLCFILGYVANFLTIKW